MGFLKDAYEAVRRVVNPTREELAQDRKALKIEELELQLAYAKRGFKASEEQEYFIADPLIGICGAHLIPFFNQADWSTEEKAQAINRLNEKLKDLGVSDERIKYLNENDIKVRHVVLNYKKDDGAQKAEL